MDDGERTMLRLLKQFSDELSEQDIATGLAVSLHLTAGVVRRLAGEEVAERLTQQLEGMLNTICDQVTSHRNN